MSYIFSGFLGTVTGSIAFGAGTRLAEVIEGETPKVRALNQPMSSRISQIFEQTGKTFTIYGATLSGFTMGAALTSSSTELTNARWIGLLGIACGALSIVTGKTLRAASHLFSTSPKTP